MAGCVLRGLCLMVLIAWTHGHNLESLCDTVICDVAGETCRVFGPLALPRCVYRVPESIDYACRDVAFRETVLSGTDSIEAKSCHPLFPSLLDGCPASSTCIEAGVCCFDPNDGVDSTEDLFQSSLSLSFTGRTYLLSNVPAYDSRLAEAVCESRGGYLAEIDTTIENEEIKAFLATEDLMGSVGVLVSGTDAAVEGTFRFNYTGRTMTFFDWESGQPDDLNNADCIQLIERSGFQWDDIPCEVANAGIDVLFLCEIP